MTLGSLIRCPFCGNRTYWLSRADQRFRYSYKLLERVGKTTCETYMSLQVDSSGRMARRWFLGSLFPNPPPTRKRFLQAAVQQSCWKSGSPLSHS